MELNNRSLKRCNIEIALLVSILFTTLTVATQAASQTETNTENIWRLGGKINDFTFTNDNGFSAQHDARRLPNGNITIYDNGNRNTPDTYALAMGNMQKQENDNVVIGWERSSKPMFTEFSNEGNMVLQFNSKDGTGRYRVFRFPWQGYPSWPPNLVTMIDKNLIHMFFSWNGSTETVAYQVLGGQNINNLHDRATVPKNSLRQYIITLSQLTASGSFKLSPLIEIVHLGYHHTYHMLL